MLRRIFRQRRRIFLFALFVTLAGVITFTQAQAISLRLATAAAAFFVVFLIGAIFIILLPRWRRLLELIGLGIFAEAMVKFMFPVSYTWLSEQVIGGTVFVLFTMFCYVLLYGRWSDWLNISLKVGNRHKYKIKRSREAVWSAIVPGAAPPDEYWTGNLAGFHQDREDPDTVNLRFQIGEDTFENMSITFLDQDPPNSCRYYFVGEPSESDSSFDEGVFEITIKSLKAEKCKVNTALHHTAMRPREALDYWMDDSFRDDNDSFRAHILGKRDWSIRNTY
ncbi:hypothetical protein [Parasulfitobacter algicola]|uniref:SMODS-associating 2TM beta-strand rich effector domain-containing protein n=1 Tax=Parasulfitobacter algicola TaxID=2614809 RepID=A0ABX2IPM6_9RHOB|nr:hypothetical protein [Sulfitobacter algicola]NSX54844.1 hypothetical protein [Sulfitobacter algicola]